MADTNETIADIIAERRRQAELIRNNLSTVLIRKWHQEAVKSLEDEANRLEAAHKRERGNAAKLREALVQVQKKIKYLIGNLTVPNSLVASRMEINGIINAALSAPPRNCDLPEVAKDPWRAWLDDKSNWDEFGSPKLEIHDWFFAPATKKEGGNDGNE